MSVKCMARVWEMSQHKGSALLLLLAIADHAADDGYAWPSIAGLAEKIRMSERHTMRLISQLEKSGELYVYRERVNNRYLITLGQTDDEIQHAKIFRFSPSPDNLSPDNLSPIPDNLSPIGDTCVTLTIKETSINHHKSGNEKSLPLALTPTTRGEEALFDRIARNQEALGRRPPKRFPSYQVKERFGEVETYFDGRLEEAIDTAMGRGVVGLTKLVNYLHGWMKRERKAEGPQRVRVRVQ